ncbi:MAG: hypothetical protein JSV07_08870 [Acidimicrobiia bacterium]|nr:MAG: hypothetical protein JSV07_08870 [Acidimicrobiia bacterium]
MRRFVAVLCVVLVACAGESMTTSSPSSPAPVASGSVTTTAPPPTATSTVAPTATIESEVPSELLALIGAPMPEVDLTIDGPEDVERWISEFLRWEAWTSANPVEALLEIDDFATGAYLSGRKEGLGRLVDAGLLGVGGELELRGLEVEDADIDVGLVSFKVESRRIAPRYSLRSDRLSVSGRLEPTGEWLASDAVLSMDPSGRWLLVEWKSR